MEKLLEIIEEFKKLDFVDAIVLSGSRTGIMPDEKSDFDIYVYSSTRVPLELRTFLANEYAEKFEVANDFFGEGDEWILPDGTELDFMYRDLNWAKDNVKSIWQDCNAWVGFTTAFVHNIKTSKILYDKNGEFSKLQSILEQPYPKKLTENVVKKNYPILRAKITASFYEQIKKAVNRGDFVSRNHRTTALLNSYFDIIFAVNKQTHPGEKRLVDWAEKTCQALPSNFRENIEAVIKNIANDCLLEKIDVMLDELDALLRAEGLI